MDECETVAFCFLNSAEKLRRSDESIRQHMAEKQKIICDMFRVPNEHFTAIADIVSQPEAPKVSACACGRAFHKF